VARPRRGCLTHKTVTHGRSAHGALDRRMFLEASPLAALSLIVAPAILTNASSVLIMSTSNRLARTVDRATQLSRELESTLDPNSTTVERRLRELTAVERRSLMLC
jgi:hypothetical protein